MILELLKNIDANTALILTAPPGWGKTYKLLEAIKCTGQRVVFLFPLRALCDEVYLAALKKKLHVLNIRKMTDYQQFKSCTYDLILCTPELYCGSFYDSSFVYILDEFHLFTYWGESFREKMVEAYFDITSSSPAIIFLTATLSMSLKEKLQQELEYNYKYIYHVNFGNQKLKNFPHKYFYYPKSFQNFLLDDIKYSNKKGISLIFCQYRSQVSYWCELLEQMNQRVIGCVGGEASEFIDKLSINSEFDFIIATSVVSHGVNLPRLEKIYFLYNVKNLDFYLQMLGRGGRDGHKFEVHIQNKNYFSKVTIIRAFLNVLIKRFSNRIKYLLYSAYES